MTNGRTYDALVIGSGMGGLTAAALHTLRATDPPSTLSFLSMATLINKALMEGVFYPKGGMGLKSSFLTFYNSPDGKSRLPFHSYP